MRQAVNDYLTYLASIGRSEGTIASYAKRLKSLRVFLVERKVRHTRNITIGHIRKWHDELIAHGLSKGTQIAYLSTISGFLHWAYEHRLILRDLSKQIELPEKEDVLPPTPLSEEDIKALFALVPGEGETGKRNRAILEVFYGGGLRLSELINLNIADIDPTEQTIHIRKGKGAKDRIVPINQTCLDCIADYLQERGGRPRKMSPLFVTGGVVKSQRGDRITREVIQRIFYKMNKKFEKHLHPHLLRHTYAYQLLLGGADLIVVQRLLGHAAVTQTGRYTSLLKADVRRAYDEVMERVLGAL